MTSEIDNNLYEIIGSADDTFDGVQPKEFKPWHKPRKQFVRRKQWAKLTEKLFEDRPDNIPLKYLSLPGIDLLDIRYMHQRICQKQGRDLRFLGFNSEAQKGNSADVQLNISLDEVRQLSNIDSLSEVIRDDFRMIANEKSLAWRRATSLGPFDVANIDLCRGLASDTPSSPDRRTMYRALERLISIQARNSRPWLMFITTRVNRGAFDSEAEGKILEIYRDHAGKCGGFLSACREFITGNPVEIDILTCKDRDYFNVMIVAFAKWLSRLIKAQNPSTKVALVSVFGYKINPSSSCEDMVSFAIRSEPLSVEIDDPLAPIPAQQTYQKIDCTTALQIARRIKKFGNIDEILFVKSRLRESLIAETSALLELARYDVSEYPTWAWPVMTRKGEPMNEAR